MNLPTQFVINLYTQKFYFRDFIHDHIIKRYCQQKVADCLGAKLIILVLLIFKANLLAANQFVIWNKIPVTLCLRAQWLLSVTNIFWAKQSQEFHEFNHFFLFSCMQVSFIVVAPKYVNFTTFSGESLATFILCVLQMLSLLCVCLQTNLFTNIIRTFCHTQTV
jgi:hypothetical protein